MKTCINEGLVIKILQTDGTSLFYSTCSSSCTSPSHLSNHQNNEISFCLKRTVAVYSNSDLISSFSHTGNGNGNGDLGSRPEVTLHSLANIVTKSRG